MKNIDKLANEIQTAREKYGPFNSTHEVYGVLIEEVEEFFDLVKIRNYSPDMFDGKAKKELQESLDNKKRNMIHELMQIAAISLRAIDELEHDQIKWV
jgi:hypothetical protein